MTAKKVYAEVNANNVVTKIFQHGKGDDALTAADGSRFLEGASNLQVGQTYQPVAHARVATYTKLQETNALDGSQPVDNEEQVEGADKSDKTGETHTEAGQFGAGNSSAGQSSSTTGGAANNAGGLTGANAGTATTTATGPAGSVPGSAKGASATAGKVDPLA